MHYVFKSKADANLIMMSSVGDQLLRIVGKEPAVKGIIELAAIPAAMRAIELAIAAEDESTRQAKEQRDEDDSTVSVRVGLHQRAWPMLEMMKRSLAERCDIVWGV
ncbi:MAG: DUF1840 domain-containing protein [Pseudomonadota bacterium]|nr:DUF1840 domain-containing protein [Pseudomonadota bacterium]